MNYNINIYEDLKLIFLDSGYVTEDECCGYDEIAFIVRKKWLQNWFDTYVKNSDMTNMQEWLEDYITSDDEYNLYNDAKEQGEIILEQKIWNNRIHYYEVYEEVIDGLETETNTFIRTMDLTKAIKVYKNEKDKIKKDENFILAGNALIANENFDIGEAEFTSQDTINNRFYSLYLTEKEIEQ